MYSSRRKVVFVLMFYCNIVLDVLIYVIAMKWNIFHRLLNRCIIPFMITCHFMDAVFYLYIHIDSDPIMY